MAERRPLVLIDGRRRELPAGDTVAGAGQTTVLKVNGGAAATTFPDYLIRLDFGAGGATINPTGQP